MFRNRRPRGAKARTGNLPPVANKNRQDDTRDNKLRINQDAHTADHDQWHRKADRPFDKAAKQRHQTGKKDKMKRDYSEDISHIGGTLRDP